MTKAIPSKPLATSKAALERTPEHGWDCAIDVRQSRRWLREKGDTVRFAVAGAVRASDLQAGTKPFSQDQVDTIREAGLRPYILQLRRFGIRPRTAVQLLRDHFRHRDDLDPRLFVRLAKNIYANAPDAPGKDSAAGEKVPDGMAFATNQLGRPVNNAFNLSVAFVRLGVSFRYDRFADRYLIDGLKGFGPFLDDAALARLRFNIDQKYGFLPDKDLLFEFCRDFARHYNFDPVCDYFDRAQETWDKQHRIERFLTDYAGADDTPYVRAVSKLLFLAVVRRNRSPGSKFDELVVLESEQGQNKSTALALLALKDEWFSDSFPLNAANRETLEHCQGKIIIEIAELQGMRKTDTEHVKAMLSRTTDRGRMAYARSQSEQPRRFIFVGTSNGRNYLLDGSGNRRFWPVAVKAFDLKAIRRDLNQLWGEAAVCEALGESIRLDRSLWAAAGHEQEKRLAAGDDPFTDEFRYHLGDRSGRITSSDAWAILGFADARGRTPELKRRFGAALKANGWRPMTIKLGAGQDAARVQGYGHGTDTRRIVVTRDPDRELRIEYEDHDEAVRASGDFDTAEEPDFG